MNNSTPIGKRLANQKEKGTDPDPETLAYEIKWIEGLVDQIQFAQSALSYYHVSLNVKRYYDCHPSCFSNLDPNLQHHHQQKHEEAMAAEWPR